MAEPRKVQFVTLSAFTAGGAAESRKRRLEDGADFNFDRAGELEATSGAGDAASNGRLGKTGDRDTAAAAAEGRATVRLNLPLSEPDERSSAEFNYGELIQNLQVGPLGSTDLKRRVGNWSWSSFPAPGSVCGLVIAEQGGGRSAPCPASLTATGR